MGQRAFAGEIAASAAVAPRDPRHGRLLLVRAVRKLLGRFSPALWESDKDLGKLNPLIQALEDDLEELEKLPVPDGTADPGKKAAALGASIIKNALKLEAEGIAEFIPVAQIRRASYWAHLAPLGPRKLLLIENADRMREEALNSLLKILEEPPERLTIVLCTARREGILPTLLSRLRPYHFTRRDGAAEGELIRRVFRDKEAGEALAAFFVSSVVLSTLDSFRRRGVGVLPEELAALGKHCAPIAGSAGLGRPVADSKALVEKVLEEARNFQIRSLFFSFLALALDLVSGALRPLAMGPRRIACLAIWKKHLGTAAAAGSLNQSPALMLDRLACDLKGALAEAPAWSDR
jgi:DNA polymerase-3 subunit gamma/tau